MKSSRFAAIALGLTVLFVSPRPATAQNAAEGSFTLQNEVRWQNAVLPAGDYTFAMKSLAAPKLIQLRGPNGGAFVTIVGSSLRHEEGPSELVVETRGSSRYVRELYLAELGVRLRYAVPKIPQDQMIAQGPAKTEHILISYAGK